jgi:hypothetical protein
MRKVFYVRKSHLQEKKLRLPHVTVNINGTFQCSASAPLPSATHTATNEGSESTKDYGDMGAVVAVEAVRNAMM